MVPTPRPGTTSQSQVSRRRPRAALPDGRAFLGASLSSFWQMLCIVSAPARHGAVAIAAPPSTVARRVVLGGGSANAMLNVRARVRCAAVAHIAALARRSSRAVRHRCWSCWSCWSCRKAPRWSCCTALPMSCGKFDFTHASAYFFQSVLSQLKKITVNNSTHSHNPNPHSVLLHSHNPTQTHRPSIRKAHHEKLKIAHAVARGVHGGVPVPFKRRGTWR